jgi:uncharacterized LabA/DUF88 family protein
MRTNVYIDGLNLYYGALKHTGFKWLNPARLCESLLSAFQVNRIEYFTALVRSRSDRPDQRIRQQTYLRALRTLPNLNIVLGRFLTSEVRMPVSGQESLRNRYVRVIKTEEKGSDVYLASHMLRDGFRGNYDVAVLVTNDSDLLEPIRIVREELGLVVGILNPHKRASNVLRRQASFMKPIRAGVLRASQFPAEIHDQKGVFRKPERW